MNINRVTVAGRLTKDPESRFTTKGTAVCRFDMAINRTWKGESGEKKEEVTYVTVDCMGKTAEAVAQYFRKGREIYVEARLKMDSWTDKQTQQKRQKLGLFMDSFQFVGKKESEPASAPATSADVPAVVDDSDSAPF